MDNPTFTVVVPVRNRWGERVKNCLRGLQLQTLESVEVLIIDYGSTLEAHLKLVETIGDFSCTLIRHSTNDVWSSPIAKNMGVRRAHGKYVATLDADCIMEPRVLETMLALHEKTHDSLVVSRIHDLSKHIAGIRLPEQYEVLNSSSSIRAFGYGALMSARQGWWHKVRGQDERMKGWGHNDNDLCKRARLDGQTIIDLSIQRFPETKVFHQWHIHQHLVETIGREEFNRLEKINRDIFLNDNSIIRNDENWGLPARAKIIETVEVK